MIIEVTYMSGAGNLFSVIDKRKYPFSNDELGKIAILLCNTNQFNGVRTEGLLSMDSSTRSDADFSVYFNNPDGSSGMMCGNGGRCAIRYANRYAFTTKENIAFSLADTIYTGRAGETIDINFPKPQLIQKDRSVIIDDSIIIGDFIVVGTEHFVTCLNVNSIEEFRKFDIANLGRKIRFSEEFAPKGTNVNFFLEWNGKLLLRTYERGVEAETGACGTGAIATVVAYSLDNKLKAKTELIPTSGLQLTVSFETNEKGIEGITLSGHAEFIGSQEVNLPDNFMEL